MFHLNDHYLLEEISFESNPVEERVKKAVTAARKETSPPYGLILSGSTTLSIPKENVVLLFILYDRPFTNLQEDTKNTFYSNLRNQFKEMNLELLEEAELLEPRLDLHVGLPSYLFVVR